MTRTRHILRIEASARQTGSVSRKLTARIIDHLGQQHALRVADRDVSQGLPFVNDEWVSANFTPEESRTAAQKEILRLSDRLIGEIMQADTLVMGVPIYNFSIPVSLKAWIDLIARAGVTFRYSSEGPVGLLQNKQAILAIASGGTSVGSEIDYATPYLRHALGFIGIHDVRLIAADALSQNADDKIQAADAMISALDLA